MLPTKIVVIGAGSAIFGLGALSTMLQSESLKGAHIALCDINEAGLNTIAKLANIMNEAWDSQMTITSSTERRDLLPDADVRLYRLLEHTEGDLAHARYLAYLGQAASFADACADARMK